MLDEQQIYDLIMTYGPKVSRGRPIRQIIADGDIPRLKGCSILEGKVSDSVFSDTLLTNDGKPLRLMFRNNRISTHDVNRGAIPFKDQVLAVNHNHMLNLVRPVLGSSQFLVRSLKPTSTVIAAENLNLILIENVLRLYMAESSTKTSLYQHWLVAKEEGKESLNYAGHKLDMKDLSPNGVLPYLLDTPSTKDEIDQTVDPKYLVDNCFCTFEQYTHIRNASFMAFGLVSQYLTTKNMVLVDTKTEHGIDSSGSIVSADELYTMDSSRFWKTDEAGNIVMNGGKPVSFSKEFARGMVEERLQLFNDEQAIKIAVRYIQGLQYLTGEPFEPDLRQRDDRLIDSTNLILDTLL